LINDPLMMAEATLTSLKEIETQNLKNISHR
jgi:hypothetical protein